MAEAATLDLAQPDKTDRSFLWRRLHSLSGVAPIGGFLIYHIYENMTALRGAEARVRAAQAALERARDEAQRAEVLFREGAIAAQQAGAAQTAVVTAAAQLDGARAERDALRQQRDAAAAALRQARAALAAAEANQRTVSVRRLDVAAAQAQVRQAEAATEGARAGLVALRQREQEVAAARAAVAQAEAALALALAARDQTVLRAPLAGTVIARQLEVGDFAAPGTPILTVADLTRAYLRVFVPETAIARVRLGHPVEVRVDAFPDRVFRGRVREVASRAEFTPGNVQTREERTKLVFAVRIEVPNPDGLLKPGLPADAVILTAVEP